MHLTLAQAKALGIEIPARTRRETPVPQGESHLEAEFVRQLAVEGVDGYVREYVFDAERDWRFDFAWPEQRLAVEIDGWGHHKPNRYLTDIPKFNAAMLAGWRVLHVTGAMIDDWSGVELARRALQSHS